MTQEQKDLLLKDLCARLPYGVKLNVKFYDISNDNELKTKNLTLGDGNIGFIIRKSHWIEYKPYLRPMSSMTEEEREEFTSLWDNDWTLALSNKIEESWTKDYDNSTKYYELLACNNALDWLYSHHLDFKGLIPMGLALPALKDMYKIE